MFPLAPSASKLPMLPSLREPSEPMGQHLMSGPIQYHNPFHGDTNIAPKIRPPPWTVNEKTIVLHAIVEGWATWENVERFLPGRTKAGYDKVFAWLEQVLKRQGQDVIEIWDKHREAFWAEARAMNLDAATAQAIGEVCGSRSPDEAERARRDREETRARKPGQMECKYCRTQVSSRWHSKSSTPTCNACQQRFAKLKLEEELAREISEGQEQAQSSQITNPTTSFQQPYEWGTAV
ncbi:uncharacterized protein B0I36DRAFT_436740, partial [Microdochium trichocladiopsis]